MTRNYEMIEARILDALNMLHYSKNWLTSGILTEDLLFKQIEHFKLEDDSNTEHYRYQCLTTYLKSISFFSDDIISIILNLLEADEDVSMASSATITLLKTRSLTDKQFNDVADFLIRTFGEWPLKHISKEISHRKQNTP